MRKPSNAWAWRFFYAGITHARLISPEVFIPIAEEHNLIVPLTRHVIAETIQQRHVFPMSSQFHIGINVAASHFRNGTLLKDLNQYWFSQHPIQQLVIELTERDALLDVDYRVVRELNRLGVKLAIDDFGTGNSSLSAGKTTPGCAEDR